MSTCSIYFYGEIRDIDIVLLTKKVSYFNRKPPNTSHHFCHLGAQWLSGRVLDSRPRGRGFKPHRHHCVVSLSKTHLSLLSTGSTLEDPSLS